MNRKFLIYICLAILTGAILGNVFYKKYIEEQNMDVEYNSYLLQLGVFEDKEELNKKISNIDNHVVIERDNKYYVYLGISSNKNNATKLQEVFKENNVEVSIKKTIIDDIEFMSNLEQFDILLDSVTTSEDILSINEVILSSYEEMVLNS